MNNNNNNSSNSSNVNNNNNMSNDSIQSLRCVITTMLTNSPQSIDLYYHYLGLYNHLFGGDINTLWHSDTFNFINIIINSLYIIYQTRMEHYSKFLFIQKKKKQQQQQQQQRQTQYKQHQEDADDDEEEGDDDIIEQHPGLWGITLQPILSQTILQSDIDHLTLWYSSIEMPLVGSSHNDQVIDQGDTNDDNNNNSNNPHILNHLIDRYEQSITILLPSLQQQRCNELTQLLSQTSSNNNDNNNSSPLSSRNQYPKRRQLTKYEEARLNQLQQPLQPDKYTFTPLDFVSLLYNSPVPHFIPIIDILTASNNNHNNYAIQQWNEHVEKVKVLIQYYSLIALRK